MVVFCSGSPLNSEHEEKGRCASCRRYIQMQIKLLDFVEFQKCSINITSADKISVIRLCALCDLLFYFRLLHNDRQRAIRVLYI